MPIMISVILKRNIKLEIRCFISNAKSVDRCLTSNSGRRLHHYLSCRHDRVKIKSDHLWRLSPSLLATVTTSRHNSSTAGQTAATVYPPGYIPEPPVAPMAPLPVEPQFNALGEPTLESLGLCNWTPTGLVQMGLEHLHVDLGLPWWGAIVTGTILLRLALFPLMIKIQRNSVKMSNESPKLMELQKKYNAAKMTGDQTEVALATNELVLYTQQTNQNLSGNIGRTLLPMAQFPIFLSVFFGLRTMAQLPIESMKTGGLFWFSNLTIADPFWLLSLMTAGTLFLTIETGSDSMKAATMTPTTRWVMRGFAAAVLPFTMNFPAAVTFYWFTTNIFSLLQSLFLKIPSVRKWAAIPQSILQPKKEKKKETNIIGYAKDFVKEFRDENKNKRLLANREDIQRRDAVRFKEAGMGPIQKTYPFDPTKAGKKTLSQK